MRLTAFFKLYKICILWHRCNLKILAKNVGLKNQQFSCYFRESSANILQMLQNLQNFANFQKCQLDNLVDFEKCCKTRIFLQKSVPIQPKTSNILPKFCQKLATTLRVVRVCTAAKWRYVGRLAVPDLGNCQARGERANFTMLVLGFMEAKCCKQIL